ncbi:MAG: tripartite tricarboxylate transporter substrate binding protein [Betaproteobacteria bacterium]|nr:tripartite tricarboxylate transporter substrate binding protein [Betaproteobacteria bacterium]
MDNRQSKTRGMLAFVATVAAIGYASVFATPSIAADSYPSRPITIVVPFGPGSGTDVVARLIAAHLGNAFGSPVVVDNKPGAGGMIGSAAVARAQPNGYTLVMGGNTTHSVVTALWKSVPYDPVRDFAPVARVVTFISMLVVNPDLPVKTAAEFVAYAKKNPGKIRYGYGNSSGRIGGEMIRQRAGIDLIAVAYKSNPQTVTDIMSGNIEAGVIDQGTALPHIKAGKVRPIAVLAPRRSSALPDVPTLGETAVREGVDITAWSSVMAPAGTPVDIRKRLSDELRKFTERGDMKSKLIVNGAELSHIGLEEFPAFQKAEEARWTGMAKAAGIKPE